MTRKFLILLLLLSGVLTACKEWQPVFTTRYNEPAAFDPATLDANTTSIANLKAMYKGAALVITDDIIIRGQVVSSDQQGNNYRTFYIQDSSGGIEVKLGQSQNHNNYRLGQWVYVKCRDLALGAYGGMTQLGYPSDDPKYETAYIDVQSLIDTHVFRGRMDELPAPVLITGANMKDASNLGRRVRLENLTYGNEIFAIVYNSSGASTYLRNKDNYGVTTWSMSADLFKYYLYRDRFKGAIPENEVEDYAAAAAAINLSQYFKVPGATDPLQVRTSGFAKFSDSEIPAPILAGAKVHLTGILTLYNNNYQLILNDDGPDSVAIAY